MSKAIEAGMAHGEADYDVGVFEDISSSFSGVTGSYRHAYLQGWLKAYAEHMKALTRKPGIEVEEIQTIEASPCSTELE